MLKQVIVLIYLRAVTYVSHKVHYRLRSYVLGSIIELQFLTDNNSQEKNEKENKNIENRIKKDINQRSNKIILLSVRMVAKSNAFSA